MFCNQCQEASKNIGCTIKGVCGKTDEVSHLHDVLVYSAKGLALVALETNSVQKAAFPIVHALFTCITNANFDPDLIVESIQRNLSLRDQLKAEGAFDASLDLVQWTGQTKADFLLKSETVGIPSLDENPDIRSLKQYVQYGLMGMAAYVEHAGNLNAEDPDILHFMAEALVEITKPHTVDSILNLVMKTGEYGVKAMALLDGANTGKYGNPEITNVNIGVGKRPGILISGHDLRDLEMLLQQTQDSGVDVYTHSEMLPSHAYPVFQKYTHLVGNYGGAWYQQQSDFESFNGPVLFTTNCLVPPKSSATYNDRIFTTGATGMPGWKRLTATLPDGSKDFSEVIALAKTCPPPTEIERGNLTIGFAHNQVLALADKILEAVQSGAIRKMVVMSGCDARQKSREYYTEFAKQLPSDTVILTSGCAKYRYNKLGLGDINGIPRVLDAGQCNDSYSWAVVALKLKEVLGLEDINELPLVFNIAWYEQKAIIVHLALLYLGVRNTHIGPTLPAFFTPNVLEVAKQKFGVATITTVEEDLKVFGLV